jgi:hypothetical protein
VPLPTLPAGASSNRQAAALARRQAAQAQQQQQQQQTMTAGVSACSSSMALTQASLATGQAAEQGLLVRGAISRQAVGKAVL